MKKVLIYIIVVSHAFFFASQRSWTSQIEENEEDQEALLLNSRIVYTLDSVKYNGRLVKPLRSNTDGAHVFGKIYYMTCSFFDKQLHGYRGRSSYQDGILILYDYDFRRFYILNMEDLVKDKKSFYNFVKKWNFELNNDDDVFHQFRRSKNLDQHSYEFLGDVLQEYVNILMSKIL